MTMTEAGKATKLIRLLEVEETRLAGLAVPSFNMKFTVAETCTLVTVWVVVCASCTHTLAAPTSTFTEFIEVRKTLVTFISSYSHLTLTSS